MGEFFGFDGRVSRLGYLWRSIVAAIGIAALAGVSLWALTNLQASDGVSGPVGVERNVITGAFLLALWSTFALASRRLRDMGLEPAHIVPLYAALWVVNAVLLEPISRIDPRNFGSFETWWVATQWLVAIPLLIWPPRTRAKIPQRSMYEPDQPTAYLNWRETA
jgi:uncharacterized membrane protein YhaH (DUF805 family)